MASKTLRIELKTDFDDSTKFDIIVNAAKIAAKTLFTTALLIKDKRTPQIAIMSEDLFVGQEAIEVMDDDDGTPQD